MTRHWLLDRLDRFGDKPALIWRDRLLTYDALQADVLLWRQKLQAAGVAPGAILAIVGDYSPNACALLIAAIANRNIVVPLTTASNVQHDALLRVAEAGFIIRLDDKDGTSIARIGEGPKHPLLHELVAREHPGLVLFSSGSTGPSKASLLDFDSLLAKFERIRTADRTLVFLQLDHIGGINTLFHGLCNGGTVVTIASRSVDAVCAAIEENQVALLPTTPTFLRMMLIADATSRFSLRSLRTITYGTEPMPQTTLAAAQRAMPWVAFKQTYGLSELGILPTRSKSSDSTLVKLGNDGFETRIVDGLLWIRAKSAMLGYLNAPQPFDKDGWFNTQDEVEIDGDFVRILGRRSEMINVGGEKVHPAEVESIVLTMDNIRDATIFGRPNPVTGQVVCARVSLIRPEATADVRQRLRKHCGSQLAPFKIPALVEVVDGDQHSYRFKKVRDLSSEAPGR
jgi:acyl-CoA synthetase (AMP-forming)/AMP-acid ligase II